MKKPPERQLTVKPEGVTVGCDSNENQPTKGGSYDIHWNGYQ